MARKRSSPEANGAEIRPPVPVDDPPVASEAPPEEEPRNLPVHVVKFGYVRASIWLNQTEQGPRYNVTVTRLYKGTDDQWYTSTSFGYGNLLALAKALDQAHTWIAEQYARDADVPF
jgi:hypothetical protein